jgi:hypothetical protein
MNTTTNSDQQKPALYHCISIENNWPHRHARYADVYVQWFVHKRPLDYAEQFAGFCDLNDPYSRGLIEESFTADEALRFAAYLKAQHKSDVRIEPQELPVPANTMGAGAVAVGGTTDFHMLCNEEGYSLPFEVWGFYNVRDARRTEPSECIEPNVILRPNNCVRHEGCALCNCYERAGSPLMAALDGTERWVCLSCFEKRSGIPGTAVLIDYLNGVLAETGMTADEKRETLLCNLDSALTTSRKPTDPAAQSSSQRFSTEFEDFPF